MNGVQAEMQRLLRLCMQAQPRPILPSKLSKICEKFCHCTFREILLAHRYPAASGFQCGFDNIRQRLRGLMPVGDEQKRRLRQGHVPTRPNCGLDGSA